MELMDIAYKVGNIVKETGKQVGEVVTEKTKDVRGYAKDAVEVASLKNQIASYKDIINKNYLTIGEYYYKKYEENPEAEIVEAVRAIANAESTIESLEEKIEDIRYAQAAIKAAKQAAAEEEETDIEPEGEVDDELAKVRENVADFSEEDEDSTEE